jgi:hypothetical protein
MNRIAGAVAALLFAATGAEATPLISEVYYDAVGADDGLSFIEISGAPGTSLTGLVIEGVNGTGGTITHTLNLTGVMPADGLFVLADRLTGGGTLVADADQILDFDLQNGPDSIVLRDANGILDAVGYGTFLATDVFAGEGSPAVDPPAGQSVARLFADVDTNDNALDFAASAPTPGAASFAVPEPGVAWLLAPGLLGLALFRRPRAA